MAAAGSVGEEVDTHIEGTMHAAMIGMQIGGVASLAATGASIYTEEGVLPVVKAASSAFVIPFFLANGLHMMYDPGKEGYLSWQCGETFAVLGVSAYVGVASFKAAKDLDAVPHVLHTVKAVGAAMVSLLVVSGIVQGTAYLAGYAWGQLTGSASSGGGKGAEVSASEPSPSDADSGHGHSHGGEACDGDHGHGHGGSDGTEDMTDEQKEGVKLLQKIGKEAQSSLQARLPSPSHPTPTPLPTEYTSIVGRLFFWWCTSFLSLGLFLPFLACPLWFCAVAYNVHRPICVALHSFAMRCFALPLFGFRSLFFLLCPT
jgi:hypothetical protein